jgi:hypothetical protein
MYAMLTGTEHFITFPTMWNWDFPTMWTWDFPATLLCQRVSQGNTLWKFNIDVGTNHSWDHFPNGNRFPASIWQGYAVNPHTWVLHGFTVPGLAKSDRNFRYHSRVGKVTSNWDMLEAQAIVCPKMRCDQNEVFATENVKHSEYPYVIPWSSDVSWAWTLAQSENSLSALFMPYPAFSSCIQ